MTYSLGAIPSPRDSRDYVVTASAPQVYKPTMLSPLPKIKNQGAVGSCVAHEGSYIAEYYTDEVCSTAFLYGLRFKNYWQSAGMYHRDVLNTLLKFGECSDKECPGNVEMQLAKTNIMGATDSFTWLPFGFQEEDETSWTDTLKGWLAKASPRKIESYARAISADGLKAALANGWPVIFSTGIKNYYPDAKTFIFHPGGNSAGYHSMAVWGWDYIDGKEYFRVSNSWGTKWGDNGWCWMSAEDILLENDAWAVADTKQHKDIRRTLKLIPKPRMTGEDVELAQTLLNKHGAGIEVDGIFGPATDAAVKAFQKAKGLTVDGIIGSRTWAALEASADDPGDDPTSDWITRAEPFLKIMVGDEYIIGGQGDELTKAYLDQQKKSHPDYFTSGRYEWLVQRIENAAKLGRVLRCEDCSGLFWIIDEAIGLIPGRTDSTADTLYKSYCTPIDKKDVRPGDILFRADSSGKMVHMAIVGRDATYEAAGTAYGIVARAETFDRATLNRVTGKVDTLKSWTHYGRPKA